MSVASPCPSTVLGEIYRARRPAWLRSLSRRYPTTCSGTVEQALHDAIEAMLRRPAMVTKCLERGGAPEVGRVVLTVAWRGLRGQHRRAAHRRECLGEKEDFPGSAGDEVDAVLIAGELMELLERLVRTEAEHGAPRRVKATAQAVWSCLLDGVSDVDAARRRRLPRPVVNRVKNAVRVQLRRRWR